jgi:hypothetical protein
MMQLSEDVGWDVVRLSRDRMRVSMDGFMNMLKFYIFFGFILELLDYYRNFLIMGWFVCLMLVGR